MKKLLKIPPLSESDESIRGSVLDIPISVGDVVNVGDTLLEIEIEKVTLEVPAEQAGTIIDISVKVGDEVSQGVPFATIEE